MSDANLGLCLLIYIIGGHLNILYLDLSIAFWGRQVEHGIYSLLGDLGWHSWIFWRLRRFGVLHDWTGLKMGHGRYFVKYDRFYRLHTLNVNAGLSLWNTIQTLLVAVNTWNDRCTYVQSHQLDCLYRQVATQCPNAAVIVHIANYGKAKK